MTTIYNYNYNSENSLKPTTFSDFINNKQNKIHNQLLNEALKLFVKDKYNKSLSDFLDIYKIVEKPSINYWEASTIIIIRKLNDVKEPPKEQSLEKYWNIYPYNEIKGKTIADIKFGNINFDNCEIIYNDYYTGVSVLKDKISGKEHRIPFKYINKNIKKSDILSLSDTFGYQIYNY